MLSPTICVWLRIPLASRISGWVCHFKGLCMNSCMGLFVFKAEAHQALSYCSPFPQSASLEGGQDPQRARHLSPAICVLIQTLLMSTDFSTWFPFKQPFFITCCLMGLCSQVCLAPSPGENLVCPPGASPYAPKLMHVLNPGRTENLLNGTVLHSAIQMWLFEFLNMRDI